MVGVAQLVEHRVVVPGVVGSSPITHPSARCWPCLQFPRSGATTMSPEAIRPSAAPILPSALVNPASSAARPAATTTPRNGKNAPASSARPLADPMCRAGRLGCRPARTEPGRADVCAKLAGPATQSCRPCAAAPATAQEVTTDGHRTLRDVSSRRPARSAPTARAGPPPGSSDDLSRHSISPE